MKRIAFVILLVLALALFSCGDADEPSTDAPTDEVTAEKTDKPTERETEKATSRPRPTEPALDSDDEKEEDILMKREYIAKNFEDMKCMWLSQFDLSRIYSDGGTQRMESDFRALMATVLDKVAENGINTVILQVRPNADSMYPSEFYPPSAYVVGSYGKDFSYDAVEIVIKLARERGLSIHAWINPLRAMSDSQITSVQRDYAIRRWYDDSALRGKYVVKVGENWYLNPAYSEVRELIIDGACEVMQKYDFDGLHMDDYFYPTTDSSFDMSAYMQYLREDGELSLEDFRRDALNKLVGGMYDCVKAIDPEALYGISPAGNYNTVYNSHYADVLSWCAEEGYIDYICPQVYFGLEHSSFDFVSTAEKWQSYIKTDSVKLIVGMSLGKAQSGVDNYAGEGKNEWSEHKDVLKRCLEYTKELDECIGVAYFCYQYFYDPLTAEPNAKTQTERDNFVPILKEITWK
jgi:uncharacterized lipoprotein YddW (UPF0748 family)